MMMTPQQKDKERYDAMYSCYLQTLAILAQKKKDPASSDMTEQEISYYAKLTFNDLIRCTPMSHCRQIDELFVDLKQWDKPWEEQQRAYRIRMRFQGIINLHKRTWQWVKSILKLKKPSI